MTYPPAPEQPDNQEGTPESQVPTSAQPDQNSADSASTSDAPAQPTAPQQPASPTPPAAPQYGAPQAPSAPAAPPVPPAPTFTPPQFGAPQPMTPQQPYAAPAPQYGAPQTGTPQYGAPQYGTPQYGAPQYGAPQPAYTSPQYNTGGLPGPGEPYNGAASADDLDRPLYGASFGQAVRRFFKNYANFTGRASRSEYWWTALFIFLVELLPLVFYIIGAVMLATASASYTYDSYGDYDGTNPLSPTSAASGLGAVFLFGGMGIAIVLALGLIVPSLALAWRRLHDGNFAGPMYFLGLIPYVGGLILIVFFCLPSSPLGRRFDRV